MFSLFYLYIVRNDDNKDDQSINQSIKRLVGNRKGPRGMIISDYFGSVCVFVCMCVCVYVCVGGGGGGWGVNIKISYRCLYSGLLSRYESLTTALS